MKHMLEHKHQHEIVSGVAIGEVVRPGTPSELGDVLAECTAASQSVLPFGGGGSLLTGRVVAGFDVGIDSNSLRGVIDYQPADLTLSVRAGTTMAEIAAVLAEKGQELSIDVPFPDRTTIGGLAATGFAGPRKLLSGSLKDAIIGCEYVRGDGLVAKAGGMVVKNVSGFEIPRFLHGSWGALAVLTAINLKVAPRPRAEATVHAGWEAVQDAVTVMHELASRLPSLAASIVDVTSGQVSTSCRVMGRQEAVNAGIGTIRTFLPGDVTVVDNDESRDFWQHWVDAWTPPESGTQIAIGARPRDVAQVMAQLQEAVDGSSGAYSMAIAPGLGSIRFRDDAVSDEVPVWPLTRLGGHAGDASAILEAGSESLRSATSPWGSRPEGHPLMVAIKQQFDPAGILNRGRLFI